MSYECRLLAVFPYNHSDGFMIQTKNASFCFKALILFMEMLKKNLTGE